jgi:hypothetical protein
MCLNLKKKQGRIVSFWTGGSSAATAVSTEASAAHLLNVIFDISPRNTFRTHQ